MSRIVEHLAELTAYRDRDLLDGSLAAVLRDLLRPRSVAIYRVVGEEEDQRWLTRARLEGSAVAAAADPLWAEFDTLPPLASAPLRAECLLRQESIEGPAADGSTVCCLPLLLDHDMDGVIELTSVEPLAAEQVRTVSSVLRVYRNFHGLLDYSERDTLTGLLNRKTFDEGFSRVAADSVRPVPQQARPAAAGAPDPGGPAGERPRQRHGRGTWLGVIDIDHFKLVNDTWGHLIGDEVLLLLSRLMRSSFRFHDHLYRFGGEEFVVLARCHNAADAATAMERLRANVERHVFPQVGGLTVSVGLTALRLGDTAATAFDRADRAVYHVKQNGRNRVGEYETLVRSGFLRDVDLL